MGCKIRTNARADEKMLHNSCRFENSYSERDLEHCLLLIRSHSYYEVVYFVVHDHSEKSYSLPKEMSLSMWTRGSMISNFGPIEEN